MCPDCYQKYQSGESLPPKKQPSEQEKKAEMAAWYDHMRKEIERMKASPVPSPSVAEGRCEDYPCCGHGEGGCPERDEKGNEIWTCIDCGKPLPKNSPSSICQACRTHMGKRSIYTRWPDERDV